MCAPGGLEVVNSTTPVDVDIGSLQDGYRGATAQVSEQLTNLHPQSSYKASFNSLHMYFGL